MVHTKQNHNSTIFALASGFGRSGIAVIRVSGSLVPLVFTSLTRQKALPAARLATLCKFYHPVSETFLDQGLVLFFPAPHSYTGEAVLEFHLHGGLSVINSFLAALAACPGLRLATRGEFTKRAFLNGQFDLTAAEAVGDLINAETEAQRLQALEQMSGSLGEQYASWRNLLIEALAYEEATIDFVDEDLGTTIPTHVLRLVQTVADQLVAHLQDKRGLKLRQGLQVVILGAPNVGKSSLLNALAQRDCAIVTAQPGTTRDLIEVHVDLAGLPVTLIDTAGLRATSDLVEREGIKRSHSKAAAADLKLLLIDDDYLKSNHLPLAVDEQTIIVVNKIDKQPALRQLQVNAPLVLVSAKTGQGIASLLATVENFLTKAIAGADSPVMTRARHQEALGRVNQALQTILANQNLAHELVAEELRLATNSLAEITGNINVEQVLDKIFSSFCIGK